MSQIGAGQAGFLSAQIRDANQVNTARQARAAKMADMAAIPDTQLPVIVKSSGGRALAASKRIWVLHRNLVVRIGAALFVAFILTIAFQSRGGIYQAAINTGDVLAGRIALVGFGIGEISISGQSMAMESDIVAAIDIDSTTNIFNFDVQAARQRILEVPSISDVSIRKIYPSSLLVKIGEVTPVARWRVDGVTFVIDGAGTQIANANSADQNLPLVIGDGAANDALMIITALENYPRLKDGLVALSRIADRRWDLIYQSGLRIKLPESGVAQALQQLRAAQNSSQLLDRDLAIIDMRVAGLTALRVAKRDEN